MNPDRVQAIRGCYLFSGVEEDSLAPLASGSSVQKYGPGTAIFTVDDKADGLRVVLAGQVRIWIADYQGRELTLSFMGPGDPFGEIALLDGLPRTANATATEETECLFLPSTAMHTALERDTTLARHLVLSLCELLRQNLGTINGFAFAGLDARLARKLHDLALDHAEISGNTARFSRQFSQTDLAQLLGVSREAINKRFKALEHDGLVTQERGRLLISNLAALAARARAGDGPGM